MDVIKTLQNQTAPVAIGGVGGSGTRLIASCLEELNYYIGSDLNKAKDNLLFTLLFKHLEILDANDEQLNDLFTIFYQGMLSKEPLSQKQKLIVNKLIHEQRHLPIEFFEERANSLFSNHESVTHIDSRKLYHWGWKEPNTHIILDRLLKLMPDMKYIHVMRNGLDMAFSSNQNQQFLWGKTFVGSNFKQNAYYSLKYWCIVHQRLLDIAKPMGNNFLLLNYDKFCTHPETEIPKFFDFLNIPTNDRDIMTFQSLIKAPSSMGRYKDHSIDIFDNNDVMFVEKLGFNA